jgi:hypothetical protein
VAIQPTGCPAFWWKLGTTSWVRQAGLGSCATPAILLISDTNISAEAGGAPHQQPPAPLRQRRPFYPGAAYAARRRKPLTQRIFSSGPLVPEALANRPCHRRLILEALHGKTHAGTDWERLKCLKKERNLRIGDIVSVIEEKLGVRKFFKYVL